MKLAIEKGEYGKILSTWSLDGKIFIKTPRSGRPRQMFAIEGIKDLWCFSLLLFIFYCFPTNVLLSVFLIILEKRKLFALLNSLCNRATGQVMPM